MARRTIFMIVISFCLLSGCCAGPEQAQPKADAEVKAPLSKSDQLRQKAKFTEAASLVGYDGKAINRDLNKIIDAQEKSEKQFEDLNDL